MFRIRTNIDSGEGKSSRVLTLFFEGLWITLASYKGKSIGDWEAVSLYEAGQNHLQAACMIREKNKLATTWQERAEQDNGFIDDDMGCND